MKYILNTKSQFEREFEKTYQLLELGRFKELPGTLSVRERQVIDKMHRKFHYEVAQLQDRLRGN